MPDRMDPTAKIEARFVWTEGSPDALAAAWRYAAKFLDARTIPDQVTPSVYWFHLSTTQGFEVHERTWEGDFPSNSKDPEALKVGVAFALTALETARKDGGISGIAGVGYWSKKFDSARK
jgi:hypothetical protein